MRAHTITTTRLALLLSLALGALGLVAFGGGKGDQAIAASETETTRDVLAADSSADRRKCGYSGRYVFAVEGGVSCRRARRVLAANRSGRPLPGSWTCHGDLVWTCFNEAGATIKTWLSCAAWRHEHPRHPSCPPYIKRAEEQRRHEQEAAGIASAGGSASGGAPDRAMVVAKFQQGRLFFSPRSVDISSGGTLTIRNGAPAPQDEIVLAGGRAVPRRFTFSLVRQPLLPKTKRQRQRCDDPGHICYAIARSHQALDNTFDVNPPRRLVEAGRPGWDTAGGLRKTGDSFFFNRNGPRNAWADRSPVSAPAGTTLYFLDAIHPWMQGRINVR
jgi:hypothetical protein